MASSQNTFFSLADLGLPVTAADYIQEWLDGMQANYPNYSPSTASQEYVLAAIFSAWIADAAGMASMGSTDLFQAFGQKLINLPQELGTAASTSVSLTTAAAPGTVAVLSSPLSTAGPITTLPVEPLANGIAAGPVTLTSGVNTQTFTTTGASAGATSMPVTSTTPNFDYPSGSNLAGTLSYVVASGTQFALDTQWAFETLTDITLTSGTTTAIAIYAVEPGAAYNGAGSGGSVELVTSIDWVTAVTLTGGGASGGVDAETDTAYLDRLGATLQTMAQRPITASDYQTMALNFQPAQGTDQQEIGRAAAIDGALLTPAVERSVSIYVTDANGMALNSDTMTALANWFESLREVNFIVNVLAPSYQPIYVAVQVHALPNWDQTTVATNIQTALINFLSPANFGSAPPYGIAGTWATQTVTIYRSQLNAIIQNVPGVDHVVDGTLAFGGSPSPTFSETDYTLPGTATLPTSNTATIPLSAITF